VIYFVQAGDESQPIKIGFARDVEKRLRGLQCTCPDQLRLLAVMDGDKEVEAALHGLMASHRIRGEWFRPVGELLDLIEAVSTDDDAAWCRSLRAQIRRRRSPSVLIEAPPEMVAHYIELRERVAVRQATFGASGRTQG
jgi:hypothetical protein